MDLLCPDAANYLDVDPYARELDDPLAELYQDLVHRLFEAPASNPDDRDRGVGIEMMLSRGFDVSNGGTPGPVVASAIQADFLKDDRVQQVAVDATSNDAAGSDWTLTIRVVANAGKLGIQLTNNGGGGVAVAQV